MTLLPQLAPVRIHSYEVVATTERTAAPLAIQAEDFVCADELAAERALITGRGQGREHLLAPVHGGIVKGLCFSCGESALGVAIDGREYCHRVGCCDWKAERWKAMQMRRSA